MSKEQMKCLYKYRPLKDEFSKVAEIDNYTLSFLRDGELHFSSPLDFNDPFDCIIDIDKTKYVLMKNEGAINNQIINKFIYDINNVTYEDVAKIYETWEDMPSYSWKELIKVVGVSKLRIYCVSETCYNTLMWSFYAKNHTGICIGFDFSNEGSKENQIIINNSKYKFKKVYYDLYHKSEFKNDLVNLFNRLYYKDKQWEHEKEYRMILDDRIINNTKKNIRIDLKYMKEIIFGVSTPIKYIILVFNKMYHSNHKMRIENYELKFYQIKRNIGSDKFDREELDYRKYIKIEE